MRRTVQDVEARRPEKYQSQPPRVTRLDRETLEGVMREDVFLAADGKALALDSIDLWTRSRRNGRRG